MEISREKLEQIMREHLICSTDEAVEAMRFAYEVLCGEADATLEKYPYATKTAERYEAAAFEVHNLAEELEAME